jgi:hypothetical protein
VKQNRLDELPIARLTEAQLQQLKQAEQQINEQGSGVYLIAFEKQAPHGRRGFLLGARAGAASQHHLRGGRGLA